MTELIHLARNTNRMTRDEWEHICYLAIADAKLGKRGRFSFIVPKGERDER